MGAARAVGEAEHSRRNKRTAATAESTFAPLYCCDANDAQLHGRLTIDDAVSVLEQHEQYLLKAQNSLMADIEARIAAIAAYVAYDAFILLIAIGISIDKDLARSFGSSKSSEKITVDDKAATVRQLFICFFI